jgi:O-antigen ligase
VPEGFVPGAGWQPDPSWPAPPPGWQLWVPDGNPFPPPSGFAPPYPGAAPYLGAAPYAAGAGPYGYGASLAPASQGTSGLAIASFVLGLLGVFTVTAVLGVVLGIAALAEIRRTGRPGRGLAITGITLAAVWIAVFVAVFIQAAFTGGGFSGG